MHTAKTIIRMMCDYATFYEDGGRTKAWVVVTPRLRDTKYKLTSVLDITDTVWTLDD